MGSQKVDRFTVLSAANKQGRPSTSSNTARPPTSGTQRVNTINFYNQVKNEDSISRQHHPQEGPLDNYQVGKVIGAGAYAQVRLVLDKRN